MTYLITVPKISVCWWRNKWMNRIMIISEILLHTLWLNKMVLWEAMQLFLCRNCYVGLRSIAFVVLRNKGTLISEKSNYGNNKETIIDTLCCDSRVIVLFIFHYIIELDLALFDDQSKRMRGNNSTVSIRIISDWTKYNNLIYCLQYKPEQWNYIIQRNTVADIVNTLRPRQNGRHFADDTFNRIFLNENV